MTDSSRTSSILGIWALFVVEFVLARRVWDRSSFAGRTGVGILLGLGFILALNALIVPVI